MVRIGEQEEYPTLPYHVESLSEGIRVHLSEGIYSLLVPLSTSNNTEHGGQAAARVLQRQQVAAQPHHHVPRRRLGGAVQGGPQVRGNRPSLGLRGSLVSIGLFSCLALFFGRSMSLNRRYAESQGRMLQMDHAIRRHTTPHRLTSRSPPMDAVSPLGGGHQERVQEPQPALQPAPHLHRHPEATQHQVGFNSSAWFDHA